MPDAASHPALISQDPEVLGGVAVFAGTRVPIKTLWDYLEGGSSLDEFLDHFPTVRRDRALAVLERARLELTAHASAA